MRDALRDAQAAGDLPADCTFDNPSGIMFALEQTGDVERLKVSSPLRFRLKEINVNKGQ